MRFVAAIACFGVALLAAGCADSKWGFLRKNNAEGSAAAANLGNPTAEQLVAYLNANSNNIQSIQCKDVDMNIRMKRQEVGIQGWMVCQKPQNFRMRASALGKDAADIGSNSQEFWYWISKGDPYLIHCSYQDLARGAEVPFPFRPEWVMEAMGMGDYSSAGGYRLQYRANKIDLIQDTTDARGQRVQKITVFNRERSRTQVTDHILRDAHGREICSAHIDDAQVIGAAAIPRRIAFSWPSQELKLVMKFDDAQVNLQFANEQSQALFNRPALAGVQSFDLGRRMMDGAPIQAASGYAR
jgi:hypothetical protein